MKKITAMCLAGTFFGMGMGYVNAQSPVELLPADLLSATSTELTPLDEYKKDGPWKIGVSFGGVGNTWIVQMHQEMKYEATLHPKIGEFLFVEANWQPAKQVSDLEDMLASGVDAIIVGPISTPLVVNQVTKAVEMNIPVITFGATNGELASTVEIMGGGEAFGLVGGEYLNEKLGGRAVSGPSEGLPASVRKRHAMPASARGSRAPNFRSPMRSSPTGTMPSQSSFARTWSCRASRSMASGSPVQNPRAPASTCSRKPARHWCR